MLFRRVTDDELVTELNARGVCFLSGGDSVRPQPLLSTIELLVGLAQSSDARVRMAIIPFMLVYPALAYEAENATTILHGSAKTTLMLHYTVALLLQKKYRKRLESLLGTGKFLPNLFATELQIVIAEDLEYCLRLLEERQCAMQGYHTNCVGAYEHAVERIIKRLECEAQWQKQKA